MRGKRVPFTLHEWRYALPCSTPQRLLKRYDSRPTSARNWQLCQTKPSQHVIPSKHVVVALSSSHNQASESLICVARQKTAEALDIVEIEYDAALCMKRFHFILIYKLHTDISRSTCSTHKSMVCVSGSVYNNTAWYDAMSEQVTHETNQHDKCHMRSMISEYYNCVCV